MIKIEVLPGVYDPAEDTHLLLDALKKRVRPGERILEIGTGTGRVAIELASMGAEVYANDIDMAACRCARANAERNGVDVQVFRGDLFNGVRGNFDVIAFNPPYLPEERDGADQGSWTGGERGCEVAVLFIESASGFLSRNGRGYMVFSSLGSEERVRAALDSHYAWKEVADAEFDFERIWITEFKNGIK
jgi:release factor glutamine methyltransferase